VLGLNYVAVTIVPDESYSSSLAVPWLDHTIATVIVITNLKTSSLTATGIMMMTIQSAIK